MRLLNFVAQALQQSGLFGAVEEVVAFKRNHAAIGGGEMDARLFQGANVEVGGVHELHNQNAKHVFIAQIGRGNLRQTTHQFAQSIGLGFGAVIGGKQFEHLLFQIDIVFKHDGVGAAFYQGLWLKIAGEWREAVAQF